jgi:hypothetical protein
MKAAVIIFLLLFFFSAKSWDNDIQEFNPCYGEHYSWSATPINPYENTIIIIDPYQDTPE